MSEALQEITDAPPVENADQVDEVVAPEADPYEGEAKKYGWAPLEDWHGDPDKHISAERYMTRGAGALKKLETEKAELAKRVERIETETATRIERMEKAQRAAYEAKMREQLAEIEEAKRRAVDVGNTKAYDAAVQRQRALEKQNAPTQLAPEDQQAITGWLDAHPDYKTNPEYQKVINDLWQRADGYGIKDVRAVLKFIDDNYQPPKAVDPVPPAVETGGAMRGKRKSRWADVPADDRKQAQRFIDDGTFDAIAKEKGITPQEAYALAYFEEN